MNNNRFNFKKINKITLIYKNKPSKINYIFKNNKIKSQN